MYLAIDPGKCTGCRACEVFCSFIKEKAINPAKARISVLKWEDEGIFIPFTCQQCTRPLCAEACPVQAIARNAQTGAMEINTARCLGCKMCILACPFGGIWWDGDRSLPIKCDLCQGDPECVKWCAPKALSYEKEVKVGLRLRREGVGKLAALLELVEGR
ncbi:MAG: 4Fe-4S dicluster domain-containing protein [Chloroflexi bacterium]|nr:4Fe-4S dicluster domain-containing protein [Chloroflexota bacterium]MCL5074416.1 4Fe-4S dicluster domain-containing protein [Chloroflexota bacterium]